MKSILILVIASVLSSCASLVPKLEKPKLSVVNVELLKSDLWSQQLKVRMRVQNPNDRTLPIKGLSYTLEVAGQEFAQGISGASFLVPARGQAEFDMNVTTNMAGTILKLLSRGSEAPDHRVDYRLTGKVSLSEGLLRSIPFEERGSFNLQ